jgi:hypothetical protein
MKIVDELIEPFSITIESDNFTVGVEKEYEKPSGEKYTIQQQQTFHTSVESAIKKIIQHKISSDTSVVDLKNYLKKYRELVEAFSAKFSHLEKLPTQKEEDADVSI